MKFVIILLFVIKLNTIYSQNGAIRCNYFMSEHGYACNLHINNPNGWNNFTEITGVHMTNMGNADVRNIVRLSSSSTTNIPSIICDTFPFTTRMDLRVIRIERIDEYSFKSCKNLSYLEFFSNRIAHIDEFAFSTNNLPK